MSEAMQRVIETQPGSEGQTAAARSHLYRLFGALFDYPDAEFAGEVRAGDLSGALRRALEAVDPALASDGDWPALCDAGEDDEALAVEYTRLFDVGAGGPPCPLYGGLWGGARMKAMEEAVRFYNHFGLSLSDDPRELPDHLTTELEFLHFLAFREAECLAEGSEADAFRRAQRDFVKRHPGRWVPKLRARMAEHEAQPFFRELVARLDAFLAWDARQLEALVGPAPAESS